MRNDAVFIGNFEKNKEIFVLFSYLKFKPIQLSIIEILFLCIKQIFYRNKNQENSIRMIIFDEKKKYKFIKFLKKRIYKNAKIIFFSKNIKEGLCRDLFLLQDLNNLKCLSNSFLNYDGFLCFDKMDNINKKLIRNDSFIESIKQDVVWCLINYEVNTKIKDLVKEEIDLFCDKIIDFINKKNAFLFLAININNEFLINLIKIKMINSLDCYVFDVNQNSSMSKYYGFLNVAQNIVYFGKNYEEICWLSTFERRMCVYDNFKDTEFDKKLKLNNISIFKEEILDFDKEVVPINNVHSIVNKIKTIL